MTTSQQQGPTETKTYDRNNPSKLQEDYQQKTYSRKKNAKRALTEYATANNKDMISSTSSSHKFSIKLAQYNGQKCKQSTKKSSLTNMSIIQNLLFKRCDKNIKASPQKQPAKPEPEKAKPAKKL